MSTSVIFWRRTDVAGLERLELFVEPEGVTASSTVVCVGDGGFRLDHRWRLDSDWHAQSVAGDVWNSQGHRTLSVQRVREGWCVDGCLRPDLDGADDPDLSVTPFCNTFPIRRVPQSVGNSLTVDTIFIDAPALTVARSRQRYVRLGPNRLRYYDLGVHDGFEADLVVDNSGLVIHYEHLFEQVKPSA